MDRGLGERDEFWVEGAVRNVERWSACSNREEGTMDRKCSPRVGFPEVVWIDSTILGSGLAVKLDHSWRTKER